MPKSDKTDQTARAAGVVGVAMVAAAAGAVAALLLAPKSGKETRAEIKDRVKKARKDMGDAADSVRDRVEQGFNDAKETLTNASHTNDEPKEKRGLWGRK